MWGLIFLQNTPLHFARAGRQPESQVAIGDSEMGNAQEVSTEGDPVDLFKLASWWRSGPEWDATVSEIEGEEEPSHLNTVNSSGGFNAVSVDKLSVQYVGSQHHEHDVGAVQANRPAPTRRLMYYFEMTVKNAGVSGLVAIGFTPLGVKMCRHPGLAHIHQFLS